MWKLITVVLTKLIIAVLHLFKRHATALPGLIAEQLHPHLLRNMAEDIEGGIVMVTGTNGKTTTAKVIRKLLESQGKTVLANRSGSNFTRGILSSFIGHASWSGKLNYDMAVLEVDEAYTPIIAAEVRPELIVVLNVMRDQLDRYGEIDNTARTIGRALSHAKGAVLNADDPAVAKLSDQVNRVTFFGVSPTIRKLLPSDDELHGRQKTKRTPEVTADILLLSYDKLEATTTLKIMAGLEKYQTSTMLEGVHNYVDIVAALSALHHLQGSLNQATLNQVAEIKPAFGRGERLVLDNLPIHLALIKNPGGFNQNIRSFMRPPVGVVLFIINDRIADGRDVSWLWDVDLGPLKLLPGAKVMTGGIRAYDMAVRLQQEDIPVELVEPKISRVLRQALDAVDENQELLIMPTYTAMLETRKLLLKKQVGGE